MPCSRPRTGASTIISGVDPIGPARAPSYNWRAGAVVQGGSTITQQLAKNLYLSPDRTFARKLDEALIALALEVRLSKDEILELYLNRVYFGAGAYGIAAAAEIYFDRQPEELTLAPIGADRRPPQSAEPICPDATIATSRASARRMCSTAWRQPACSIAIWLGKAKKKSMGLRDTTTLAAEIGAGHAIDWVYEQLPELIAPAGEHIIVETTLDRDVQRVAAEAVETAMAGEGDKLDANEAAVVLLDGNGAIRALIGGRDYAASPFNRAVKAKRQAGSAFKPFVYLTALEHGDTPEVVIDDAPIRVGTWTPENHDGKYRGRITLRDGARPFHQHAGGPPDARQPDLPPSPRRRAASASPRSSAAMPRSRSAPRIVTPLELTAAFVPFANGGRSSRALHRQPDRHRRGQGALPAQAPQEPQTSHPRATCSAK